MNTIQKLAVAAGLFVAISYGFVVSHTTAAAHPLMQDEVDETPVPEVTVQIETPVRAESLNISWLDPKTNQPLTVGTFTAYDLMGPLQFHWQPDAYEQVDREHTAYRVFLRQYFPWAWPFFDPTDLDAGLDLEDYQDVRVAYHWASNPNGTSFTIPLLYNEQVTEEDEWVCTFCPTHVIVQPMRMEHYKSETGQWEYRYTSIPGAQEQWSQIFVISR